MKKCNTFHIFISYNLKYQFVLCQVQINELVSTWLEILVNLWNWSVLQTLLARKRFLLCHAHLHLPNFSNLHQKFAYVFFKKMENCTLKVTDESPKLSLLVIIISLRRFYDSGQFKWLVSLSKKCPYSEFFWSVYSRFRTEYREILRISPYSIWMRENTDKKHSMAVSFIR